MFDDESDQGECGIYNKIYSTDNNMTDNLLCDKSENFQDSFFQTFNDPLYDDKYQLTNETNLYLDNLDYQKLVTNHQVANQNDSISTLSSSKSSHQQESEEPVENLKYIEKEKPLNQPFQLGGKRGRPMTDKCLIIDETSNKIYDPEIDPEEYRKARKRIQNRESAIRSRIKKKENDKQSEAELDLLRKENYRLNIENSSLKRERVFLYDQVKFLQNLIKKDSNIKNVEIAPIKQRDENISIDKRSKEIDTNKSSISDDIEKNTIANNNSRNALFGTYKKPANKLFMIGVFCIISLVYVTMNNNSDNNTISFTSDYSITTKENENNDIVNKSYYSFGKIFAFACILLIIIMFFNEFFNYFSKKIKFLKTKFLKHS